MEIYLIRHGQTDANSKAIIQGRVDNPLNATGKAQAKRTAEYLKQYSLKFDYCVASPLSRAIETMHIIKEQLHIDLPTHIEPDIIEREFGELDGKPIPQNYFQVVHQGLAKGMETDQAIEQRVRTFFYRFFQEHQHERVLMVAHSHVIKALLVQYIDDFSYDAYLNNCSINRLTFNQDIQIIDYNIDPLK